MKNQFTVTRRELAHALMTASGLQIAEKAMEGVDAVLELITDQLSKGNRVELRNFGIFEVVQRKAKKARNVFAGTVVKIPRRKVVKFWMGKDLQNRVTG